MHGASEPVGARFAERTGGFGFQNPIRESGRKRKCRSDADDTAAFEHMCFYSAGGACFHPPLSDFRPQQLGVCVSHVCVRVLQPVFLLRYVCPGGTSTTVHLPAIRTTRLHAFAYL